MKIFRLLSSLMALMLMLTTLAPPVLADRGRGGDDEFRRDDDRRGRGRGGDRDRSRERFRDDDRRDRFRERDHFRSLDRGRLGERDWVLDRRHRHDHYYPRRGLVVRELPRDFRIFHHHRRSYYFHDGVWYLPSISGFVVITPPIGLTLPILPPFHTTIWVGGVPYFYAYDVYYRWLPEQRLYIVSEPPPGMDGRY